MMPRRPKRQLSTTEAETPLSREETRPPEAVTLGVGSRSRLVDNQNQAAKLCQLRGLLSVPAEVEAEIRSQEAKHPMTPEYRQTLRDRLTLEQYFSGLEVAFRRTPDGIEILAAGLDEIAEFRRNTSQQERQGVVYGMG